MPCRASVSPARAAARAKMPERRNHQPAQRAKPLAVPKQQPLTSKAASEADADGIGLAAASCRRPKSSCRVRMPKAAAPWRSATAVAVGYQCSAVTGLLGMRRRRLHEPGRAGIQQLRKLAAAIGGNGVSNLSHQQIIVGRLFDLAENTQRGRGHGRAKTGQEEAIALEERGRRAP